MAVESPWTACHCAIVAFMRSARHIPFYGFYMLECKHETPHGTIGDIRYDCSCGAA